MNTEVPDALLTHGNRIHTQSLNYSIASTYYRVQPKDQLITTLHSRTPWAKAQLGLSKSRNVSEREFASQIIKLDRMSNRKIGKLSMDLSCAFEPKGSRTERSQGTLLPTSMSDTEQAIKSYQQPIPKMPLSQNPHLINRTVKKHLTSIYKTPEVMENINAIADEKARLGKSNSWSCHPVSIGAEHKTAAGVANIFLSYRHR